MGILRFGYNIVRTGVLSCIQQEQATRLDVNVEIRYIFGIFTIMNLDNPRE